MTTEPDDQADPQLTREERATAVASVRHSTELEGGRSTDAARALQDQWIDGRIDVDELGRRTRALHELPTGKTAGDDADERVVEELVQAFLPDVLIDTAAATLNTPDLSTEGTSAMAQQLPTWIEIAKNTRDALNEARNGLSTARDWMNSDWPEGHGPADHEHRHEAARLISQAKALIDQAKHELERSTGR
ncbi:antitoxin VbhA family protein [Kribbella solani]|uniref:Antitoxin VbhA domain-containing protein n=1 Tax=Kribbella solani TaxID=236067 RepID=A0A841DZF2_9ACTN|nr:antitoxin VbhA family protein [Kribbella solani]MBB5984022.1 hypothetical protein [Kribbella solani]